MKVSECFKDLKPGMFVKTNGGDEQNHIEDFYIIGKIGAIVIDGFYIFTNTQKVIEYGGCCDLSGNSILEGFKESWFVHADNTKADIEILDKLPEEKEEEEEENSFGSGCPLEEMEEFNKKLVDLSQEMRSGNKPACCECQKLEDIASKLRSNLIKIYSNVIP